MSPKKKSDIKWRRSFQCAIQCHEIDAYFSFTNQIWKIKENTLSDSCFMIKFKKNFNKFNFNTKPNAWTIRFNEIYEYFLCVTPKTVFFSCGCKYHIFIDFHLMYCWQILANKHHDMPNTNYDKFSLVVSTLFLNKWYLKKSTFFENDPYKIFKCFTVAPVLSGHLWDNDKLAAKDRWPLIPGFKLIKKKNTEYFHFGSIAQIY